MTNEMTAKEAVKELKALLNMCDPSPLTKELEDALKMAIKALEQRWISVSERLPNDNTVVFYTDNKGETGMICYWEDLPREFEDIIAWMPLPEPYREDEK